MVVDAALLGKGDDFAPTDIAAAWLPPRPHGFGDVIKAIGA